MKTFFVKISIVIVILFLSEGCGNSPLSEQPIKKISALKAEIVLGSYSDGENYAKVVLKDSDGKDIANKELKVKVNDVVLPLTIARGNYYDTYPYYKFPESSTSWNGKKLTKEERQLLQDSVYQFFLTLSDSSEYSIAHISIQKINPNINIPQSVNLNEDAVMTFQDVPQNHTNNLKITSTSENISAIDTVIENTKEPFHIPKILIQNTGEIYITLTVEQYGLIHSQLLSGSYVKFVHEIKKTVTIK